MINWHEVEEKIAQERYQIIVEERQVQKQVPAGSSIYEQLLNWIGNQMVRLGQQLQRNESGQTHSITSPC